jgi:hypothetical protein
MSAQHCSFTIAHANVDGGGAAHELRESKDTLSLSFLSGYMAMLACFLFCRAHTKSLLAINSLSAGAAARESGQGRELQKKGSRLCIIALYLANQLPSFALLSSH